MTIYFITSSFGKFTELQNIIHAIEQKNIDVPEIQNLDSKKIISEKLVRAFHYGQGEYIVEDTSLYFFALNGLPGPFIKWFLKTIGTDGLYKILEPFQNKKAVAKTVIGYGKSAESIHFFEGEVAGTIVKPRGKKGFGWDAIFIPIGADKTFGEMTSNEKQKYSMRAVVAKKLLKHITK